MAAPKDMYVNDTQRVRMRIDVDFWDDGGDGRFLT